jgi:hypothetical protein
MGTGASSAQARAFSLKFGCCDQEALFPTAAPHRTNEFADGGWIDGVAPSLALNHRLHAGTLKGQVDSFVIPAANLSNGIAAPSKLASDEFLKFHPVSR